MTFLRRNERKLNGALALGVLVGWMLACGGSAPPTSAAGTRAASAPTEPSTPPLELLSARTNRSSDSYIRLEGQVKNVSSGPLERVAVVVTWYAKDETMVTSDSAVIEYDPILAGQTSPFTTITRWNPAISTYRVEFKRLGRGTIEYTDKRK